MNLKFDYYVHLFFAIIAVTLGSSYAADFIKTGSVFAGFFALMLYVSCYINVRAYVIIRRVDKL